MRADCPTHKATRQETLSRRFVGGWGIPILRDKGRRFKSSLPDHSFQALKLRFWFFVYSDGVETVDGARITDFPVNFPLKSLSCFSVFKSCLVICTRTLRLIRSRKFPGHQFIILE
jgi:hypothetical protein